MKKHIERKHQNQQKQYVVSNYLCTVQWRLNQLLLVYLVQLVIMWHFSKSKYHD